MAIDLLAKKEKQTRLIIVLVVVLLITFVIVARGFFGNKSVPVSPNIPADVDFADSTIPGETPFVGEEGDSINFNSGIQIDLTIFDNPIFDSLETFEKIKPLEEESGRENPFKSYY
jgi:hypothetical protein